MVDMKFKDKILHALVSFIICWVLLYGQSLSSVLFVCAVALGIGAAKEMWDHYNPPHCCDLWDLFADLAGIMLFLVSIYLYTILGGVK